VIPAAGSGSRMAADRPKQYLPLAGRTVLEHSLDALLSNDQIAGGVLALAPDDVQWQTLAFASTKPLWRAAGGRERSHSVLNALDLLGRHADAADWVLVHDAARPCLRQADLEALIQQCRPHPVGGLLAVPVKDTLKRARDPGPAGALVVEATVDRSRLWQAQTPQMFRLGSLRAALAGALAAGVTVTDEASAMEWAGHAPLLVAGHADNLKLTTPDDLRLAEAILRARA
jgi:2-C-methyl-D-erythritol 4-phosphate cytidylyltransferase